MVNKAIELAKTHGWVLTRQFENEANPDMHSRTTAREISTTSRREARLLGNRVRYRGHAQRCSTRARQRAARHQDRRLRTGRCADALERLPAGANPDGSPAKRNTASNPSDARLEPGFHSEDHGRCRRHGRDQSYHHHRWARRDEMEPRACAEKEGIFVGITAGATFAGGLEVCKGAAAGSTVLCMLPDTGERYLSTPLLPILART